VSTPSRPVAPSVMRPPPRVFHPFTFGKYYLIDRIGQGGMAEVFRALPLRPGRDPSSADDVLVIKRILPHIAENEDFVDMFADEAKITAALRHPNVVRVFDFGRVHTDSYLAMEYVDGKDLRNVLRRLANRERFLDLALCAAVAHEVCQGLHYAHTLINDEGVPYDVVHRDVSPANVLLGYDGQIKLTDFGVAKASSNVNRTKSGIFKGKFDYMSPEQAEGLPIDQRADVFAAGIVLFEMITCRRLFKAESEIATLQKIRDARIPSIRHYRPGVAPELEQITLRALSREPADRFGSAAEMAEALREFLAPTTLEEARERISELVRTDFAEERAAERQRLSAALNQMPVTSSPRLDASWDGGTPSIMAMDGDAPPPRDNLRSALTGAAVMVGVLAVFAAIGGGVYAVQPAWFEGLSTVAGPQGLSAEPQVRTGVEMILQPPARVTIDGVERGNGTHVVVEDLEPGTHVLEVAASGYRTHEAEFDVQEGRLAPMMIRLKPKAAARDVVDPTLPWIVVESEPPGAEVRVDGESIGVTPLRWTTGELGQPYILEIAQEGYFTHAKVFDALEAGKQLVDVELEPDPAAGPVPRLGVEDDGGSDTGAPEAVEDPAPPVDEAGAIDDAGVPDLIDPFEEEPAP